MILHKLVLGTKLSIGKNVLLEITQIGKKCHHDCEIKKKIGECAMPKEGIFTRVLRGGMVQAGDIIEVI